MKRGQSCTIRLFFLPTNFILSSTNIYLGSYPQNTAAFVNTNFSNCRKSNNWKEICFANNNLYWCIMSTISIIFLWHCTSSNLPKYLSAKWSSRKKTSSYSWHYLCSSSFCQSSCPILGWSCSWCCSYD